MKDIILPQNVDFNRSLWQEKRFENYKALAKKETNYTKERDREEIFFCGQKDKIYTFLMRRFSYRTALKFLDSYHRYLTKILHIAPIVIGIVILIAKKAVLNFALIMLLIGLYGIYILVAFPILFGILAFIFNKPRKIPSNFNSGIAFPNLSIAILAGWLVFVPLTDEHWKINVLLNEWIHLFLLCSIILVGSLWIFYYIRQARPDIRYYDVFKKIVGIFAIGMSFSIGCGLFIMQGNSQYALSGDTAFLPEAKDSIPFEFIKKLKDINEQFDKNLICTIREDSILSKRKDFLVEKLIETDKTSLPVVSKVDFTLPCYGENPYKFYIFPRLLILNALISFFIGFFAQLSFRSNSFRE